MSRISKTFKPPQDLEDVGMFKKGHFHHDYRSKKNRRKFNKDKLKKKTKLDKIINEELSTVHIVDKVP